MKSARMFALLALAIAVASPAAAQDTTHKVASAATKGKKKAAKEDLKALAKISKDSARTIAMSKVPAGSKVKSSELERENGLVIYSFDIKVPNQSGIEEVNVNAMDGTVVAQSHESAKTEKAEAKKEKAEAKAAKKP